jgi:hypothetical protein
MAEMRESNKMVVKVDVDVSDALKGLKALRREANETLKALQKLDESNWRMREFHFEVTFPVCGHKEKLKLTSFDQCGIEEVVQKMFEARDGLCLVCYNKMQPNEK